MKTFNKPVAIALIFIAFLLIDLIAASLVAFYIAFFVPKKKKTCSTDTAKDAEGRNFSTKHPEFQTRVASFCKLPFEEIHILAYDKAVLTGRLYIFDPSAPLAICFHGYRGGSIGDIAGLGFAEVARDCGFNLLLTDQRAHGSSGGRVISFGAKEQYDVLSWVKAAIDIIGPNVRVCLFGLSMGAATVLLGASRCTDIKNVCAIIADSPFSTGLEATLRGASKKGVPIGLASILLKLGSALWGGFSLSNTEVVNSVSHLSVPILLLHGEADRLLPCGMSKRILASNPTFAKLVSFPKTGHALCYFTDRSRYTSVVSEFLSLHFGTKVRT